MGRRNKELPLFKSVQITGVAAEGKALARIDDMVVFTQYAVPGDIVDLQVTKKKKSYMEAQVVNYVELSQRREEPFCEHYGICGGCKWQIMPYEDQLRYKQEQVSDVLHRIGKVQMPPISPIIGSEKTKYYRNKLEFSFSNKKWLTAEEISREGVSYDMRALGFHIPGKFDKVLDIDHCYLQTELSDEIRAEVKAYSGEHNLEFYDYRQQSGFLRNLVIRTTSDGKVMLILVFYREDEEARKPLLDHLIDRFPQISSLFYYINGKCNDTLTDLSPVLYYGSDFIEETMEGLRFKIGPKSFYQTNTKQAYELYKVVREFASLTGSELVYDLYTGTGTIACFVAKSAKKVIGIEYVPEAIEDAKVNAEANGIGNTQFYAGDMKDVLTNAFVNGHGRPDVLITDPPRDGMHPDVVNVILGANPRRIVYVSCNPATQARDLNLLDSQYRVMKIQPVDMFPHTHHVENVVLLERRDQA